MWRSSFRRSRDNGPYRNNGFRRGLHHYLVRRSKRLRQHTLPQVPTSASGNRSLGGPLRIKPVRMGTPNLLFALDERGLEVIESTWGVQQRYNLGLLCYSAALLKILIEFKVIPPGARSESGVVHPPTWQL